MARGRRPQGNYKGKAKVLSTRITTELREAIEASADAKGHSLSQEIEHRLRRSFDEDQNIIERFGNRRNYAVLRLISSYMDAMHNPTNLEASWLDDPYVFAQLAKAIIVMLDQLRPPGDPTPPISSALALAPNTYQGDQVAAYLLQAVKDASPGTLPTKTDKFWPAALIRADLGEIGDRISISPDAGDAITRFAEQLVPRQNNETDEDWRKRATVAEILAMRLKDKGDKP
jgi:hypothetical protein